MTDEGRTRLDRAHEIVEEVESAMTAKVNRAELEQAKSVPVACARALREE